MVIKNYSTTNFVSYPLRKSDIISHERYINKALFVSYGQKSLIRMANTFLYIYNIGLLVCAMVNK